MGLTLDVFNSDAFNVTTRLASINKRDHVPSFLGDLGLFDPEPITTIDLWIEEEDETLGLVQTGQRSTDYAGVETQQKRTARAFTVPHLKRSDAITADELGKVRAFGTDDEVATAEQVLDRKSMKLQRKVEMTWENLRLGAVRGSILDADSTVIYNLFTEFGVTQETEVAFNFAGASAGDVLASFRSIVRTMTRNLKSDAGVPFRVVGIASDTFFDELISHADVYNTYINWAAAQSLREEQKAFRSVIVEGVEVVNYRGSDDGTTVAATADKCHFFPVGVPGLFIEAYAPADRMGFENTQGLPVYEFIDRDKKDRFVEVEVQSNMLPLCTKPKVLMLGKKGS